MEQHPIKINKVQIRNLQIEDYAQLSQSFTRVYSDGSDVFWTHKQIQKLINIFPEGQIVTVVDDKIVGCALSIIVDYDKVKNDHTYAQVTGKETFNTHNPEGNILYGINMLTKCVQKNISNGYVNVIFTIRCLRSNYQMISMSAR